MKKIILLSIFSLFLLTSYSQEKNSIWLTNIDQAIAQSMETEKPIMLFFTGSDWCGWCKRLVKEVFDQKEFKDWAKDKIIPVELDFPRRKKLDPTLEATNNELQNIFQVRGFPTVWLFSVTKTEEGKFSINANLSNPFQKMGYMGSAKDFISKAEYILEKMNEVY